MANVSSPVDAPAFRPRDRVFGWLGHPRPDPRHPLHLHVSFEGGSATDPTFGRQARMLLKPFQSKLMRVGAAQHPSVPGSTPASAQRPPA
jgi:hypothetical protein